MLNYQRVVTKHALVSASVLWCWPSLVPRWRLLAEAVVFGCHTCCFGASSMGYVPWRCGPPWPCMLLWRPIFFSGISTYLGWYPHWLLFLPSGWSHQPVLCQKWERAPCLLQFVHTQPRPWTYSMLSSSCQNSKIKNGYISKIIKLQIRAVFPTDLNIIFHE